ncbi:MAG: site-specific recombinase [Candidatus Accumulibacter sp.]|jgi:site-specific recombinase|nr:site-specific recombinase [Accumulibacter sp.]
MESLLACFAETDADAEKLLAALVAAVRPENPGDAETARRNLKRIALILEEHPQVRAGLREAVSSILRIRRHSMLYTTSGILPNTGFFSEFFRRLGHKFLPDVLDAGYLQNFLRRAFCRSTDGVWVVGVGEDAWLELIEVLRFGEEEGEAEGAGAEFPHAVSEILRSLRIVSHWIAASGLEPELLRLDPDLDAYESPFSAQCGELDDYVDTYLASWRNSEIPGIDDKHLRVLFAQCREVIERLHNRAARFGTSVRLTYILQRLGQLIERMEKLLDVVEELRVEPDGRSARSPIVRLFTSLVRDECRRDDLAPHWRRNTELIALRITENASSRGEHYIAENRKEYFGMARSALIGGFVIAFMATLKLLLGKTGMPPLMMTFAYCLNYGLGFCLIHIIHGSVATKQPAMTANAIAAGVEQVDGKLRHLDNLALLIARTFRTQTIAILGNVFLALPLAALLAWGFSFLSGSPLVTPEKAAYLLESQTLTRSGTLLYAAIAGVCLFLAGLINAYFDNYATYNRVAERILQLEWLRRAWGGYRAQRIAVYVGENLGALSGNFLFGFLLGGASFVGALTALPIDIRHVTFSSAYVGFAAVGLDLGGQAAFRALIDVAVIGFVNLAVSFALAFHIALRARRIDDVPWRQIACACLRLLREHPGEFFFPAGEPKTEE